MQALLVQLSLPTRASKATAMEDILLSAPKLCTSLATCPWARPTLRPPTASIPQAVLPCCRRTKKRSITRSIPTHLQRTSSGLQLPATGASPYSSATSTAAYEERDETDSFASTSPSTPADDALEADLTSSEARSASPTPAADIGWSSSSSPAADIPWSSCAALDWTAMCAEELKERTSAAERLLRLHERSREQAEERLALARDYASFNGAHLDRIEAARDCAAAQGTPLPPSPPDRDAIDRFVHLMDCIEQERQWQEEADAERRKILDEASDDCFAVVKDLVQAASWAR